MAFNLQRLLGSNTSNDPESFDLRIDRPIVVRGVRLALGEIESLLNQQAEIRQSRVVAVKDETGQPRLVAFIVPARDDANARQLQEHLRHVLPMHLLPEQFVLLGELPLTAAGEVDETHLPMPELTPAAEETVAQSRGERFLLKLWRELLQTDSLGPSDDFFQRGGDEALAQTILARIETNTGVKLTLDQLRAHSRLRDLASLLDQASPRAAGGETSVELRPGEGRPIFLIPAAARTSLSAIRFVNRLHEGQRVVGLEYPQRLPNLPPAERVPALAKYFAAQMCAIQPQGPYTLMGNCMGGMLVFETARQLTASGNRVERLITIDSAAPALQWQGRAGEKARARSKPSKRLKNVIVRLIRSWNQRDLVGDIRQVIKYLWDAKSAYRATGRYDGSTLVIMNGAERESQRASDWQAAAPQARIHYIEDTDHLGLVQSERAIDTVGQLMNEYLDSA